jgi:hypothetical protein
MELKNHWFSPNRGILKLLLQWVNLRPEESDRTLLMFAFYTCTSIGLRWSEDSTVALFLDEYGSKSLPWIYIASAVLGTSLVFFYSWLQKIFPLRSLVVAIAPLMFAPLILFRLGLQVSQLAVITIFMLRLWVDAFYVLNDLNTSITANQLFNIREIKRTYPLVSSGILVADVIAGFSLPLLLLFVGLDNVIIPVAGIFIALGAGILWYIGRNYRQAFPDTLQRAMPKGHSQKKRMLSGSLKSYAWLLFAFFALLQVIGVLIDFQYLTQIKSNYDDKQIASFLGIFGGIAGLCELAMQWFVSSRILERCGVFVTVATLPATIGILLPLTIPLLSLFSGNQSQNFFSGIVILKFLDELLRYTFITSSGPLLFQPIPDRIRTYVQTLSGGIAESVGAGGAGIIILVTFWLSTWFFPSSSNSVLVVETALVAIACLGVIWLLQSQYVNLLVMSAGRGKLSGTDVDLLAFKQAVIKSLGEKGTEADKRSCIELLSQIDPQGVTEVLAPLLAKLPSDLQKLSLEVMLTRNLNPAYLSEIRPFLEAPHITPPSVFALALRYVWLTEPNQDLSQLEEYLQERNNSLIRATAAALILCQGTPLQKAEATTTLRKMLTHKLELERVNGVKALREVVYLQALRIHIPNLLKDDSLRVRCAVLEMIAATQLEDFYWALLSGLYYKSTRLTAMRGLVKLENEGLPMLSQLATNLYKPELARMYAWRTIGQIPTPEAMDSLWLHLETSRGTTRDHILRTLLKRLQNEGSAISFYHLHENKVEKLITEELRFLGEIYAAYIDFKTQGTIYAAYINFKTQDPFTTNKSSEKIVAICELLQRALLEVEIDVKERLLLLLKLLYPLDKIQAVAFNLRSESVKNFGRGLEILQYTVTLQIKSVLLNILDRRSPDEKLQTLVEAGIVEYQQMTLSDRTRSLLLHENSLSDWCLACCFHFALSARIRLTTSQVVDALRHPTGLVREAAIAYLNMASLRILLEVLPQLENDPHPLVAAQVKDLMERYQIS